jgi:translation initiation factor 2B subunit (eIF-2B alpha/beta/delta family)
MDIYTPALHPCVRKVIKQLHAAELHAARSGREVMYALCGVVEDSNAQELTSLVNELEDSTEQILRVLPAYAPPLNVIFRIFACLEKGIQEGESIAEIKIRFADELSEYNRWVSIAREKLPQYAAHFIQHGMTIFTHTLSETVMRVMNTATKMGIHFQVLVSESQPNCDGVETARQLAKIGVRVKLGLDAGMGDMVRQADLMLTGAEAITPECAAVCKVGTYLAALATREFGVPYYILADTYKFIPSSMMSIFARDKNIHSDLFTNKKKVEGVEYIEEIFDTTPPQFITGVVTEKGVISPLASASILKERRPDKRVLDLLNRTVK